MKKVILIVVLSLMVMVMFVPMASAASPSESGGGYWYYVNWGETVYSVSRVTGVTPNAIINANGIGYPYWLYAGTYIWIPSYGPGPGPGPVPPIGCRYYHHVQWGQTLYSISQYYGVSAWTIAQANGIYNMNYIYAGQSLCIP